MVNLEHKLTVDDLIVEYMICKVKNGYEPSFTTGEFVNFLFYFESKMTVYDTLYDGEKLFKRFFERKNEHDWSVTKSWYTKEKEINPHMDMVYSSKDTSYLIKANYKLGEFDRSIINTYFMDNGMGKFDNYEGQTFKIRKIIEEYLSNYPKRQINESIKIDNTDLLIGQYVTAEIISNIWDSYLKDLVEKHKWPIQCKNINKYLFEIDLAEIIGVESIRIKLIELYNALSKRIAILYHNDGNLKISTYSKIYLSRANYDLLIKDYEKILNNTFGPNKKSLDIDLSSLTFKEIHEIDGVYFWDDDPDIKSTTNKLGNEKAKKLILSLDKFKEQ